MSTLLSKNVYTNFLLALKDARVSRGITQGDLAIKLKSTQSFVSKVERGERRLDVLELRKWCKAIGVEFTKFVKSIDVTLDGDK